MFRLDRFVRIADLAFCALHACLWAIVIAIWTVDWQKNHAPIYPVFNTAKHFIDNVDLLVFLNAEAVSLATSLVISNRFHADLGLVSTISYSFWILLAGSLQWFLLGRLVQWLDMRYGPRQARWCTVSLFAWIVHSAIRWVTWWWF